MSEELKEVDVWYLANHGMCDMCQMEDASCCGPFDQQYIRVEDYIAIRRQLEEAKETIDRYRTATAFGALCEGSDRCQGVTEKQAEIERLRKALNGLLNVVDESTGVHGYHLNGDVAPWHEFQEVQIAQQALAQGGEEK